MSLDSAWTILASSFYCPMCMGPPRKKKDKQHRNRTIGDGHNPETRTLLHEEFNTSTNTVDVLFEGINKFHDDQILGSGSGLPIGNEDIDDHYVAGASSSFYPYGEDHSSAYSRLNDRGTQMAKSVKSHQARYLNNKKSYDQLKESAIDDVAQQIIMENRAARLQQYQEEQEEEQHNILPNFEEDHNLFYTAEDMLQQRYDEKRKSGTIADYVRQFFSYLNTTGLELVSGRRRQQSSSGSMLNPYDAPVELDFHRRHSGDNLDETNVWSGYSRNSFHTINSITSMSTQRIIFPDNHLNDSDMHEGDATLFTFHDTSSA